MPSGYEALRQTAAWVDLSARARIVARGRDRARFLHNVTSNDVKKMTPGDSCYAFLLTPQGRIVGDVYLTCRADDFLIDTEPEIGDKVRQHILKYKVADQVELEDVSVQTAAIGVEGPGAPSIQIPSAGYTVASITETGQPGYRIYCSREEMAGVIEQLEKAGAVRAAAKDARIVRMENGKPRYGEDILETSLPQETRQMHAVSFIKGCYLGQEIVERIRARGHVNRELVRLELDPSEPAAPGTKATINGAETEITSSVYSPALGKTVALGYARVTVKK
jgi:folate-binding protein YgfZ